MHSITHNPNFLWNPFSNLPPYCPANSTSWNCYFSRSSFVSREFYTQAFPHLTASSPHLIDFAKHQINEIQFIMQTQTASCNQFGQLITVHFLPSIDDLIFQIWLLYRLMSWSCQDATKVLNPGLFLSFFRNSEDLGWHENRGPIFTGHDCLIQPCGWT